uniref:GAF domain-containing protein n=1 Tax=Hemiselmis andersenii TaxID=464988 RepID=A0A6T8N1T7_HEMAN|mmetsp:Transcript_3355/g.7729  ORF Transcript_3355/g.7729 Transcript_3355/m.7729 type:complete len:342 (+) Transcript_3355:136-1161(+)
MVSEEPTTPRQPLPVTAAEYLSEKVYPTLEPALEAMLQAAFPADAHVPEGEEEKGVLDAPLVWLAKYLKDRNTENSAKRDRDTWQTALELAGSEADSYQSAYDHGVAAARSVLWPCSVIIAIKDTVTEQVPATPREPEPKPEGEEEEPAAAEEGEEGEEKKPEMKDVSVPVLRYVATSHPDKRSIEGWVLRYEEQGRTGSVVASAETLVVERAAHREQNLHFFCGRAKGVTADDAACYCAVPLKEQDGSVYGVLAMDTLLDGRMIGEQDVERLQQLAAAVDRAREPFAAADREKRRLEEEAAEAARLEEEEKKRLEEEAAAAEAAAEEGEGAEGGADDKGN